MNDELITTFDPLFYFKYRSVDKLIRYLNEQSKNGLHIQKISASKLTFLKDKSRAFVYLVTNPRLDNIEYCENSQEWTQVCKVFDGFIYSKALVGNYEYIKKSFTKTEDELIWLRSTLNDEKLLQGMTKTEYIFSKDEFTYGDDYKIEVKRRRGMFSAYLIRKKINECEYLCSDFKRSKHYFIDHLNGIQTKNVKTVNPKRSLIPIILSAIVALFATSISVSLIQNSVGHPRNNVYFSSIAIFLAIAVISVITMIVFIKKPIRKQSHPNIKKSTSEETTNDEQSSDNI